MVEIQIRITGFFIYACTHYKDITCFKLTLANFDYLSLSFSSLFDNVIEQDCVLPWVLAIP